LLPDHPWETIETEALLMKKIDHPNVMKVYSLGHGLYKVKGKEDVSMRYMEMELA